MSRVHRTYIANPIRRQQTVRNARAPHALEENVETIKRWEEHLLHARTRAERFSDWITTVAASGPVLFVHVLWFAGWILWNLGVLPVTPFDRFPFPFLTVIVSLEAIFLALVVLASQNRLSRQADKRAHLNLQIDLLAEREMTAALQLLHDIATHLQINGTVTAEQLRDLAKRTDLQDLTAKMDELGEGHDRRADDA